MQHSWLVFVIFTPFYTTIVFICNFPYREICLFEMYYKQNLQFSLLWAGTYGCLLLTNSTDFSSFPPCLQSIFCHLMTEKD